MNPIEPMDIGSSPETTSPGWLAPRVGYLLPFTDFFFRAQCALGRARRARRAPMKGEEGGHSILSGFFTFFNFILDLFYLLKKIEFKNLRYDASHSKFLEGLSN